MGMCIVTLNVPDQYLDKIQQFKEQGKVPNRSEAIRQAVKAFLKREPKLMEDLSCAS